MENENKNAPQNNGKKKNFHKRKSYFIEPPQNKADGAKTPTVQEQPKAESSEGNNNTQNAGRKQHNNNRPHRHGGNNKQDKNRPAESMPQAEIKKNEAPSPKIDAENDVSGDKDQNQGNQNKKRNKKKNKNKRPKQASAENTESKDTVQPTAEKPQEAAAPQKKRGDALIIKRSFQMPTDIDESEYDCISFPSISDDGNLEPLPLATEEEQDVKRIEVVGIRFKSTGKIYYFDPKGLKIRKGEHAIVETARGLEYGDVAMSNSMVRESDTVPPLRPVVRIATPADVKHHEENKKKEDEAFAICNEKILAHKLDMKLIDAQFTFDNSKLLFYFTSSGRVDFRDLVKDLAGAFRTRIELRQIGIRDEAKIMGGVGMCGRPLCCTLFLSDFGQVSIKMAKEQNLSLNCAKISGICGRLMCCLRYEHDTYEYEIKRTPPVDSLVHTADGNGIVTEISPLLGTVKVRLASAPDNPPKTYKREDVVMLKKKNEKANTEK